MAIPGHNPIGIVPEHDIHSSDIRNGWTETEVPVQVTCTACGLRSSQALIYTWRNNEGGDYGLQVLEPGAWIEIWNLEYGRCFLFCFDCYDYVDQYIDEH